MDQVIFTGTMTQFNGFFQAMDMGPFTNFSLQFTLSGVAGLTLSVMQVSNDKIGWVDFATSPAPIAASGPPATVTVSQTGVAYRYVRFTLSGAVLTDTMTVTFIAK